MTPNEIIHEAMGGCNHIPTEERVQPSNTPVCRCGVVLYRDVVITPDFSFGYAYDELMAWMASNGNWRRLENRLERLAIDNNSPSKIHLWALLEYSRETQLKFIAEAIEVGVIS